MSLGVVHGTWSLQSKKQQKHCTSFQPAFSAQSSKQINELKTQEVLKEHHTNVNKVGKTNKQSGDMKTE